MAKSDLLKEAIADAKAVKETALANAKIALQEAFQPRIKSMLENELMNELEDEDMMDDEMVDGEEVEMGMDDMDMDSDMADETPDMVGVAVDLDNDGDYDLEGEIGMDDEEEMEDMLPAETDEMSPDMEMTDDMADDMGDNDMDLDEIIRELEEDLDSDEDAAAEEDVADINAGMYSESTNSIEELIEAILAEEEEEEVIDEMAHAKDEAKDEEIKEELEEAYKTVSHLKSVINEVNLLNAKLLYTNKLFRNFELSESQKMKVIENFDRAANTREAKLVFSTLAESFQTRKAGKKIVKESKSMASRPVATTAPSKQTTQVLTEGFEQANRWKKLAGLK